MSSVSSLYICGGKHVPCELFVQRTLDLLQRLCTTRTTYNTILKDSEKNANFCCILEPVLKRHVLFTQHAIFLLCVRLNDFS